MGLFKSLHLFLGHEAQGDPEGLIHWNTFCKVSLRKQFKQKQERYFRFLYPASILFVPLVSPHDLLLKQNLVRIAGYHKEQLCYHNLKLTEYMLYHFYFKWKCNKYCHINIDETMPCQCFS